MKTINAKVIFHYHKPIVFMMMSLMMISACGCNKRVPPASPSSRPPTMPRVLNIWLEDTLVNPSSVGCSGIMLTDDVNKRFTSIGIKTRIIIGAIGTAYPSAPTSVPAPTRDFQNVFYACISAAGGTATFFHPDAVGLHRPFSINNDVSPGAIENVLSSYTSADPVWTRARACTCCHEIGHAWLDTFGGILTDIERPYHNTTANALMNGTVNAAGLKLTPPLFPEFLPAEKTIIESRWP